MEISSIVKIKSGTKTKVKNKGRTERLSAQEKVLSFFYARSALQCNNIKSGQFPNHIEESEMKTIMYHSFTDSCSDWLIL